MLFCNNDNQIELYTSAEVWLNDQRLINDRYRPKANYDRINKLFKVQRTEKSLELIRGKISEYNGLGL